MVLYNERSLCQTDREYLIERAPMAERRTQAERRDATRRRLLEAAAAVFARKGFNGASVLDVVEEAGCSTGALYAHFAGKDDLFLAVFDEELSSWAAGYGGTVDPASSVDEALTAATTRWRELLDDKPAQFLLLVEFWSAAMRDPKLRASFVERHARIREIVGALISMFLQARGETGLDPAACGSIVTALADGLALQRLIAPESVADDLFFQALKLLFGGIADARGTTSEPSSARARRSKRGKR